jgi:ribonuclease D
VQSIYVDDARQLAEAVAALRRATVIGFDTEFVGEATYQPVLCLVQVSTGEGIWVIDPLVGLDLSDFWDALTAPGVEIVAVAARQELLFCLRYAKRAPETVFDPQLAAGLLGWGYPMSHTNLLQQILGVRVEGGETFTDWRRRPLSKRQLDYAADDVRHLIGLREKLLLRAKELDREAWLEGEARRFAQRVMESESEERWWRVSGSSGLGRRDLAVLRELWRWRDKAARKADVPAKRVLSDDLMMMIAKRKPATPNDLFALRGFERTSLRREGEALVAAVQEGMRVPDAELPALLRTDDAPQTSLLVQLAAVVANSLAARQKLDPSLLATSSDLQELIRWHLGRGKGEQPAIMQGWRGEILGQALLDLLEGKSAVRVTDVTSSSPIGVEAVD